jgi:hypothetical protein
MTTRARLRPAAVVIAPAVLFAGFVYHPYVSSATDAEAIASAVVADTTRWGIAHLAIGVGYALMVLAFLAIRSYLREGREERWSSSALPLVAVGSALFAILPGMEFAPLAAAETGGDVEGAQQELMPWFVPILLMGAITFTLGVLGLRDGDRAQRSAQQTGAAACRRSTRCHGRGTFRSARCCADSAWSGRDRRALAIGVRDVEASDAESVDRSPAD